MKDNDDEERKGRMGDEFKGRRERVVKGDGDEKKGRAMGKGRRREMMQNGYQCFYYLLFWQWIGNVYALIISFPFPLASSFLPPS